MVRCLLLCACRYCLKLLNVLDLLRLKPLVMLALFTTDISFSAQSLTVTMQILFPLGIATNQFDYPLTVITLSVSFHFTSQYNSLIRMIDSLVFKDEGQTLSHAFLDCPDTD